MGQKEMEIQTTLLLSFEHGLVFVTTARATPTMVMPPRKLFQIGPVTFSGPCKSPAVNVQVIESIIEIINVILFSFSTDCCFGKECI
ncbi:hypothetical protein HanXRQr2_Chr09g0375021 [Helianthus annuus]|uniref:Uncharacterized protein n=1 Tax=Helianthus annuus TaxID=4232 RepID=A0A9K3N7C4_HELAN|nr:hypothetical protein HanXRQr2_Chr09g0375021 [Helianthus annuus]